MKSSDAQRDAAAKWWMVVLASLGGGIEFYDFIVYVIFARSIAASFFPSSDPLVSLIGTYTLFAVSYFIRPLGGLIWGPFLDRHGRRSMFLWSLLIMSFCSISMALIPGYAVGGIAASLCFVVLRLVQSACFGGEVGGAVTYIVELIPRRAGLACGILFSLLTFGALLATGTNLLLLKVLPSTVGSTDAWRFAFGLGGVFGVLGYFIRRTLDETPAFQALKDHATKTPFRDLYRSHLPGMVRAFGLCAATGASNGILLGYLPSYLPAILHSPAVKIAPALTAGTVSLAVLLPLFGWMSDKLRWIYLHRAGCVLLIVLAWPIFHAFATQFVSPVLLLAVLGACMAMVSGSFGPLLADLFPTEVRASGVTTSYNVAMAIFQGLTPLACALLIRKTKQPSSPAIWLASSVAIALICGLGYRSKGGSIEILSMATADAENQRVEAYG
jgi:MHS family proline/betaine transporter-like MFS transporter